RGDVLGGGAEGVEHEAGQPRGEHRVPSGYPPHRVGELGGAERLGDVASGAGPDHTDDVLAGIGHRQREEPDRNVPTAGDDVAAATSAPAWQVDVEQHDVGHGLPDDGDRRLHISPLPDDTQVRRVAFDLAAHPAAHQGVVVDDDDSQLRG